jgi:hypothetical protein
MRLLAAIMIAVGLCTALSSGCSYFQKSDAPACATCAKGATEDLWCDGCKQGFVGGQAVTCKGCYDEKKGGAACAEHAKKEG